MGLPTELARVTGRTLRKSHLQRMLRGALAGKKVSLCMHRVHRGARRSGETLPDMSIDADALDEVTQRLLDCQLSSLTVTFDDGYADAAEYVASRSPKSADVGFIFFVCPKKTERREAFSWDEAASADDAHCRLATVDECRALTRLTNVRLGNHSNSHHRLSTLSEAELREELRASHEDFNRLFGSAADFALPYGTPGAAFGLREVTALRELGYSVIWSTEPRTAHPTDDVVLPRYALDGTWTVGEMLAWIAVRSVTSQVRRAA